MDIRQFLKNAWENPGYQAQDPITKLCYQYFVANVDVAGWLPKKIKHFALDIGIADYLIDDSLPLLQNIGLIKIFPAHIQVLGYAEAQVPCVKWSLTSASGFVRGFFRVLQTHYLREGLEIPRSGQISGPSLEADFDFDREDHSTSEPIAMSYPTPRDESQSPKSKVKVQVPYQGVQGDPGSNSDHRPGCSPVWTYFTFKMDEFPAGWRQKMRRCRCRATEKIGLPFVLKHAHLWDLPHGLGYDYRDNSPLPELHKVTEGCSRCGLRRVPE